MHSIIFFNNLIFFKGLGLAAGIAARSLRRSPADRSLCSSCTRSSNKHAGLLRLSLPRKICWIRQAFGLGSRAWRTFLLFLLQESHCSRLWSQEIRCCKSRTRPQFQHSRISANWSESSWVWSNMAEAWKQKYHCFLARVYWCDWGQVTMPTCLGRGSSKEMLRNRWRIENQLLPCTKKSSRLHLRYFHRRR